MLEPFGCQNEKPVFMLSCGALVVSQMKDSAFKHYRVSTPSGKTIMCFNGSKNVSLLKSQTKKHLIVELENNTFKNKTYAQAILKDVYIKELKLAKDKEKETIVSLVNKYFSDKKQGKIHYFQMHELENVIQSQNSLFGTIVVVDSRKVADRLSSLYPKLKNYIISHVPMKNKQNTILVSHEFPVSVSDFVGYKTIIFTRSIFANEKVAFCEKYNVYAPSLRQNLEEELRTGRDVSIMAYNIFKKHAKTVKANNIFEWVQKINSLEGGLSASQLVFSLLAFVELGFMKIESEPEFSVALIENPPKRELSSSSFMNKIASRR